MEKRIGELEPLVAELERRLAENWTDMDLLAAYTSGREELDACSPAGRCSSPKRRRKSTTSRPRRPGSTPAFAGTAPRIGNTSRVDRTRLCRTLVATDNACVT